MQELFPSPSAGRFGRRQKRERGARIPVTVVTGFLGAGKTTLVKHFLQTPEGHGTAVLVNEFGEAGIDDALLRDSTEKTVLLGNGCLCCNFRSDLQMALHRMVVDRERGVVPPFGRVLIETSGLADPSPILTTFATDRALGGEFFVEAVITVIAAADGIEDRRQIRRGAPADHAGGPHRHLEDRHRRRGRGRTCSRRACASSTRAPASSRPTTAGSIPPGSPRAPRAKAPRSWPRPPRSSTPTRSGASPSRRTRPIAWEPFARAMETLIALRGADLLRVKGFLNVAGCKGPVVVQFVQHIAHPPVELAAWPDADRKSRVVFITRDIGEREVRDLLAAVRI